METGKRPLVRRTLREGVSALDFFLERAIFVVFSRAEVGGLGWLFPTS